MQNHHGQAYSVGLHLLLSLGPQLKVSSYLSVGHVNILT